jgi:processive 1,2-diacylglycerol beta-glucosyltransferase
MQKVLVLSAAFGDGHNTVARNIREALELSSDDVKVEVLDLLATGYGSIYTIARKAHLKVVRYAPSVWSTVYSRLNKSSSLGRNLGSFLFEAPERTRFGAMRGAA